MFKMKNRESIIDVTFENGDVLVIDGREELVIDNDCQIVTRDWHSDILHLYNEVKSYRLAKQS